MSNNADIIIAVISTAGLIFGILIKLLFGQKTLRHESTRQHAENKEATAREIGAISTKIDMVHDSVMSTKAELRDDIKSLNSRLDKHIDNHFKEPLVEQRHLRAVESD